jgi:hypothetical protein
LDHLLEAVTRSLTRCWAWKLDHLGTDARADEHDVEEKQGLHRMTSLRDAIRPNIGVHLSAF